MKILESENGYYEVDILHVARNKRVLTHEILKCARFPIIPMCHDQMYREEKENEKLYDYDNIGIEEKKTNEFLCIVHWYARRGYYYYIEKNANHTHPRGI